MPQRRTNRFLSRVSDALLGIDNFGESINFTIKGRDTYPSFAGALITIIITFTVIGYGVQRFSVMMSREDSTYQTTTNFQDVSGD